MIHILRRRLGRNRLEPVRASKGVRSPFRALTAPLSRANNLPSLAASFGRTAGHLGFSHYVISRLSRASFASNSEAALEMICANYPDQWVRHYQKNGYALVDPVHRTAFTRTAPYRWDDITDLNRVEQHLLDEAMDAGLVNGISVPIHEPMGRILLVNLSGPTSVRSGEQSLRLAYQIGMQFHFEFERLTKKLPVPVLRELTERQRECLMWVARGKTSWEIGKLLDISRHTVDYHIDSAMKALNLTSRTSAAVRAAALGLIRL